MSCVAEALELGPALEQRVGAGLDHWPQIVSARPTVASTNGYRAWPQRPYQHRPSHGLAYVKQRPSTSFARVATIGITALIAAPATALAAFPSPTTTCQTSSGLQSGWCGDGGPAARALLYKPSSVSAWPDGSFVVMDSGPTVKAGVGLAVVRRVSAEGMISVAAGTGRKGSTGDHGPATAAQVSPGALATLPDGGFLIAETESHRVRRVFADGTITTIAGLGRPGSSGDGGPATAAALAAPSGLAVMSDGGFLIADSANARIRRVGPDGTISTVAGDGRHGTAGDWGPATLASLRAPSDVAAMPDGGFVIVDQPDEIAEEQTTLVKVVLASGAIFTFQDLSDLGLCSCELRDPEIAVAADGALLITTADSIYRLERDLSADVAGGVSCGFSGDGGLAGYARFSGVADVAALPGGGYLVADGNNSRVRRVDSAGRVATVAGGGGHRPHLARAALQICRDPAEVGPFGGFKMLRLSSAPARQLAVSFSSGFHAEGHFKIYRGGRLLRTVSFEGSGQSEKNRKVLARSTKPGVYEIHAVGRANGKPINVPPLDVVVKG